MLRLILSAKQFAILFLLRRHTHSHKQKRIPTPTCAGYHRRLQCDCAGPHLLAVHRGLRLPQRHHRPSALAPTSPAATAALAGTQIRATFCASCQSAGDNLRHDDGLLGGRLLGKAAPIADTDAGAPQSAERRGGGTCCTPSPHGARGHHDDGRLHLPASARLDIPADATVRQLLLPRRLAAVLRLRAAQPDEQRPQPALLHLPHADNPRALAAKAAAWSATLLPLQTRRGRGHATGVRGDTAALAVARSTHHLALPAQVR